jgi:hypothetical protein
MSTITGKVSDIKASPYGNDTFYNFTVNGKSYGAGKFPPKGIVVGDYIEFVADTSGKYPRMDTKSVRKVEPTADVVASSAASTKSNGASEDKKQQTISRQAAHNTAVAFFDSLRQLDALPKPTAKSGEKLELFLGIVDKLADHFYDRSMGVAPAASAPAAAGSDTPAPDTSDEWDN